MFIFALKWAGIIFGAWLTLSIGVAAIYLAISDDRRRREEEFQRLEIDEFTFHRLTHEKRSSVGTS
jgi:hypothetical protein